MLQVYWCSNFELLLAGLNLVSLVPPVVRIELLDKKIGFGHLLHEALIDIIERIADHVIFLADELFDRMIGYCCRLLVQDIFNLF